jgi:hypothetical protein
MIEECCVCGKKVRYFTRLVLQVVNRNGNEVKEFVFCPNDAPVVAEAFRLEVLNG